VDEGKSKVRGRGGVACFKGSHLSNFGKPV